ncbi:MAG: hypothetical protein WDO18_20810 [Acidobacteriota bacterium]
MKRFSLLSLIAGALLLAGCSTGYYAGGPPPPVRVEAPGIRAGARLRLGGWILGIQSQRVCLDTGLLDAPSAGPERMGSAELAVARRPVSFPAGTLALIYRTPESRSIQAIIAIAMTPMRMRPGIENLGKSGWAIL